MTNFQDKKIIITGATGGIGDPLVRMISEEKAQIYLISSNIESLEKIRNHIEVRKSKCYLFKADLSKEEGIMAAAEFVSRIKDPDILINLAGSSYFGSLGCQNPHDITSLYNLNLLAPTILTQSILPQMISRNSGHIVNIGSIFGSISFPFFTTYSASKAGLRSFSEALRREVSASEIKVSYIAPRAVKTKINHGLVEEFLQKTKTAIDDPEDVARKIIKVIKLKKKNSYFGFLESFFVRLNYMFPKLVDCALKPKAKLAAEILIKNQNNA